VSSVRIGLWVVWRGETYFESISSWSTWTMVRNRYRWCFVNQKYVYRGNEISKYFWRHRRFGKGLFTKDVFLRDQKVSTLYERREYKQCKKKERSKLYYFSIPVATYVEIQIIKWNLKFPILYIFYFLLQQTSLKASMTLRIHKF
jgi:hypothetical protein